MIYLRESRAPRDSHADKRQRFKRISYYVGSILLNLTANSVILATKSLILATKSLILATKSLILATKVDE